MFLNLFFYSLRSRDTSKYFFLFPIHLFDPYYTLVHSSMATGVIHELPFDSKYVIQIEFVVTFSRAALSLDIDYGTGWDLPRRGVRAFVR